MKIIVVDVLALIAMGFGGMMVLAQRLVRTWWRYLFGGEKGRLASNDQAKNDPAHYVLAIFGMMLFAFGLMMISFSTTFYFFR